MQSILRSSAHYPTSLATCRPAPEDIYFEGDLAAANRPLHSVIGSRTMTSYGSAVISLLIPPLVRAGLGIVSGLAYGVDSAAHRCALQHGGTGVAVLGSALDRLYPTTHRLLAAELVEKGGLLLSQFPPGTPGYKGNFPLRNRLIAGLAPVLLIIEAADPSGTFSTAHAALDLGREVCVVPADITRAQSNGTLRLLKEGARAVSTPEDILSLYQLSIPLEAPNLLRPALTGSLASLYACISRGTTSIDALVQETGFPVATTQSLLSVLELDGYITLQQSAWHAI
jgi:DNA processing protein